MNSWYKFLLQDDNISQVMINFQLEFKILFDSSADDDVKGATLLSKFHRHGAMIYFSPNAANISKSLIEKYQAAPCSPPNKQDDEDGTLLSFLAGDQLFFVKNFPINV